VRWWQAWLTDAQAAPTRSLVKEKEMDNRIEPLLNDEYTGLPTKRALAYIQSKREQGAQVVGAYCGYAPLEIVRAMGAVPAILCAYANGTIETAETILPSNLCPLIKSSYGFILKDTCPFFSISDAVVGETTCDGKKKMFELISENRPMFVMDLPQLPDEAEAVQTWTTMLRKFARFLEKTFGVKVEDEAVEAEIRDTNRKNILMDKVFSYAAHNPPLISWVEAYDLILVAQLARASEIEGLVNGVLEKLEKRKKDGIGYGPVDAPRVLVTGCPVGGDATKVFRIIEEAGGRIVALDACSGMKSFTGRIEEGTGDPYAALAKRYLKIPCSCMTPNTGRLAAMDVLIERFRPDAVVEVVLHACHTYNIESYKVGEHVKGNRGIPYLKIVTDYSTSDVEGIRTRTEALFESMAH
jgi:benzoyl-CoA reductase/2-hydroxyglutaryl-CoA dehydratase subunit BcrC/BadD/HgdB